eukprot:365641-Chlamydomonas_euryale.AAC.10
MPASAATVAASRFAMPSAALLSSPTRAPTTELNQADMRPPTPRYASPDKSQDATRTSFLSSSFRPGAAAGSARTAGGGKGLSQLQRSALLPPPTTPAPAGLPVAAPLPLPPRMFDPAMSERWAPTLCMRSYGVRFACTAYAGRSTCARESASKVGAKLRKGKAWASVAEVAKTGAGKAVMEIFGGLSSCRHASYDKGPPLSPPQTVRITTSYHHNGQEGIIRVQAIPFQAGLDSASLVCQSSPKASYT